nr:DegT/DnrJ/EryC1/StrS family aminotransferase [Tianweitania aestuarii]
MPDIDAYRDQLVDIWATKQLTNGGQKSVNLEQALKEYLGIQSLALLSNGTIALMVACRALKLTGEFITTPFTFIATVHALAWCGLKPVFVDIDPVAMTIDPERIEAAVTPQTSAIVGVHVYGNRCAVDEIDAIAKRHKLKVIYDAAHAFGTRYRGRSIADFGDVSTYSFHSTKLFHTGEGGAVATRHKDLDAAARSLRNFGIASEESIPGTGINAKMSELQAGMGLAVLPLVDDEKVKRRSIFQRYNDAFNAIPGITTPPLGDLGEDSFQYYCLRVVSAAGTPTRDELYQRLKTANVFSRRYFWPLCSDTEEYKHLDSADPARLPNAHRAAREVLCLPLYGTLKDEDVSRIINALREACGVAS